MAQEFLPADKAVHSDFLIHWTGKDIDSGWYDSRGKSKTSPIETAAYIARLTNILRFGLWMTEERTPPFRILGEHVEVPRTPMTCFTELKLSESRRHARQYGRLGIGVKRPFLFHRFGRPISYFGFSPERHEDKFLEAISRQADRLLLNFFKPMNADHTHLGYEFYSESEWRILMFDELLRAGKIIDPRDKQNVESHEYFKGLEKAQQDKLKYLVPLDGWLAMIIYPSLAVKNAVQWEEGGARSIIKKIKSRSDDPGNNEEGERDPTRGNWPVEVDLDACAHF